MITKSAATVWRALVDAGARPAGRRAYHTLRVEGGMPLFGPDLDESTLPQETGRTDRAVSFTKGCYIGQETIARLDTYKGVKQQLWGIQLEAIAPLGAKVLLGEESVGQLTSVVETETGAVGLVYIRTKAGGAGLQVTVDGVPGRVVVAPYLQYGRSEQATP